METHWIDQLPLRGHVFFRARVKQQTTATKAEQQKLTTTWICFRSLEHIIPDIFKKPRAHLLGIPKQNKLNQRPNAQRSAQAIGTGKVATPDQAEETQAGGLVLKGGWVWRYSGGFKGYGLFIISFIFFVLGLFFVAVVLYGVRFCFVFVFAGLCGFMLG